MFGFAEYGQVTAYAARRFEDVGDSPRVTIVERRLPGRRSKSVRRVSATMVLVGGLLLPIACSPDSDRADGSIPPVSTSEGSVSDADGNLSTGESQSNTGVMGSSVEVSEPARHVPHPPYPVFFPTNRFWPE